MNANLKQHLLAASSTALRICGRMDWATSYERLHIIHSRATPAKMMMYKHAIELCNLYNSEEMSDDWVDLNLQQNFNGRLENVQIFDNSRIRVGKNIMMNRLTITNNKIDYKMPNLSKDTYKLKCKNLFLQ